MIDWVDYNPNDFFWPAQANCGDFYSSLKGQEIVFSANSSIGSEDGNIIEYIWDFGDGTIGSGITPKHIFTDEGYYSASVTIIDEGGHSDYDSTDVIITNEPIEIDICSGFYEANLKIINPANFPLNNVSWKLDYLEGIPMILSQDFTFFGVISSVPPGEHVFQIGKPMGFGSAIFKITVGDISKTEKIIFLGPLFIALD